MIDLPPPVPVIEVVVANEGMSKGLRQTDGVQVNGNVRVNLGKTYAGVSYKNVDSPAGEGEASAYIGVSTKLLGLDLDGRAAYKRLTDSNPTVDAESFEFTGTASRGFGPVTTKVSVTYSPDDLGGTGQSTYVEGGAALKVLSGTSVSANVGRRERDGAADYTAFNAGVSQKVGALTLDARYYDTAQSHFGEVYSDRVVVSARIRF